MSNLVNNFEVPNWAGKPPPGLHLDVMKETKMIQKLMVDEKKAYFFGRNKQLCDFVIDHASCSRVHGVLLWHKHLNRPFIIDLGSKSMLSSKKQTYLMSAAHGSFIGSIRLEKKKPQQVPIDSEIHFGASTRRYIIRERPQTIQASAGFEDRLGDEVEGGLLGLPETENELDNLTEFNTAHNRRIAVMGDIPDVPVNPLKRKRKSTHVGFADEEDVINPEDIDPSVGRFRNMIQTTVIATKKPRLEGSGSSKSGTDSLTKKMQNFGYSSQLYRDIQEAPGATLGLTGTLSIANRLGLPVPNLAPNVEEAPAPPVINPVAANEAFNAEAAAAAANPNEPRKKKYAKEAWPGKKPTHGLLV